MADLLSRLVSLSVAQPGKGELVAIVCDEGGQVVEFAEGVLDEATASTTLALLELFLGGTG